MGNTSSQPRASGPYLVNHLRFGVKEISIYPNIGDETSVGPHLNTIYNGPPLLKIEVDAQTLQVKARYANHNPLEFTQELESPNSFLLRVPFCRSLTFKFQLQMLLTPSNEISSLTFVTADTRKQLDSYVDVKLLQNPNLQNEDNVVLLGDFKSKSDAPHVASQTFLWTWEPPFSQHQRQGGWPLRFAFCEYVKDQHKLSPLAGGDLWITERPEDSISWQTSVSISSLPSPLPATVGGMERAAVSSTDGLADILSPLENTNSGESAMCRDDAPLSPRPVATHSISPNNSVSQVATPPAPPAALNLSLPSANKTTTARVGVRTESWSPVPAARPDMGQALQPEDGPMFRSLIAGMERRSPSLKAHVKMLLKRAVLLHDRLKETSEAERWFGSGVVTAAKSNLYSLAVVSPFYGQPGRSVDAMRRYTFTLANDLHQHVIAPLRDFYENDMKMLEIRKREFDDDSNQYYSWMSRYLGTKKERKDKTVDADAKYTEKRRNFELNRFDYYTFLLDIHGGKKVQYLALQMALFIERLSTNSIDLGNDFTRHTQKSIAETLSDIRDAEEDWAQQCLEREMNRRTLERSMSEMDASKALPRLITGTQFTPGPSSSTSSSNIPLTINVNLVHAANNNAGPTSASTGAADRDTVGTFSTSADASEDFVFSDHTDQQQGRKEGLLWALSRPGGVQEMQKQGLKWHKYWVVQDHGQLCEYTNWKQKAMLHNEPIDLKLAHVRESLTGDRRFCFEVVTPQYKRVYQATSDDDMHSWIKSITKGITESLRQVQPHSTSSPTNSYPQASIQQLVAPKQRDTKEKLELLGRKLSLKAERVRSSSSTIQSPSLHSTMHRHNSNLYRNASTAQRSDPIKATAVGVPKSSGSPLMNRHESTGAFASPTGVDASPREAAELIESKVSNRICADCACNLATPDWVSINLLVVLCIDCSGVHRSLGTHISKVRSLHLDFKSFTPELLDVFKQASNHDINLIWEAKLGQVDKQQFCEESARVKFITQKYVEKKYIQEIEKPNVALRRAVEHLNILDVCSALASRANPSTTSDDDEPLLIYALKQSDLSALPYSVAELLLLNGATIPNTIPEFMSEQAKQFLQSRTLR